MVTLKRSDASDPDFLALVRLLDADLALRDGEEHAFYAQFNKVDYIRQVIVASENGIPVGCGAFKAFDESSVEIKRMYVLPEKRGRGIAAQVLIALEDWAAEAGYRRCVLETGRKQPEAIALYIKNGYLPVANYGQYAGVENSLCFEKKLDTVR